LHALKLIKALSATSKNLRKNIDKNWIEKALKRLADIRFYPLIAHKGKCAKTEPVRNLFKVAYPLFTKVKLGKGDKKLCGVLLELPTILGRMTQNVGKSEVPCNWVKP
jgi:hypothetical protein